MNVLVVEPDAVLARGAKKTLQHDCRVRCVSSAQQAIDAIDENLPDVIVLEPQLGLHNGIEFLYELRSYPEWLSIPVVIWTANVNVTDRELVQPLRLLGVQEVLYKPRCSLARLAKATKSLAVG